MSIEAADIAGVLGVVAAVGLVCRHPGLSRYTAGLAAGAAVGSWLWWHWPAVLPAAALAAAVALIAGPGRFAFIELSGVRPRTRSKAVRAGVWLAAIAMAAGAVAAVLVAMGASEASGTWWRIGVLLALIGSLALVVGWILADRLCDFLLGPLLAREPVVHETTVADTFVVRQGSGRAVRYSRCVVFASDPTVWQVSAWRRQRLDRRVDRSCSYRVRTSGFALRCADQFEPPQPAGWVARLPQAARHVAGVLAGAATALSGPWAVSWITAGTGRAADGVAFGVVLALLAALAVGWVVLSRPGAGGVRVLDVAEVASRND